MTAPHIELVDVSKRFGAVQALDHVSLDLAPGNRVALVGENGAGKSSLMNVLFGLYSPDSGEVRVDGQATKLATPTHAMALGIGMVHQHFTLVPTLTVAENVVLGHEPSRLGLVDVKTAENQVRATCARLGFQLDVRAKVSTLSVGSQQKVEIVKALHRGARVLVLDEPTAVLTPQEADELFSVVEALNSEGMTVVLVSHKLKDVLRFAKTVVVLRKGKQVAQLDAKNTTAEDLAALMLGEAIQPPRARAPRVVTGVPLLALRDAWAPNLHGVSIAVHANEIVGVAGVDGNGQRELALAATGLLQLTRGTVEVDGLPMQAWSPEKALQARVAHVPEDRLTRGIVGAMSVEENVALSREAQAPFAQGMFIDATSRRTHAITLLQTHDVRPANPLARAGALSGGNQQKLVMGRAIEAKPRVLVAVQPTRGLDLQAVEAMRRHLISLAEQGAGVLLVSLDLEEILALSDRVEVMFAGKVQASFGAERDEAAVGRAMMGVGG